MEGKNAKELRPYMVFGPGHFIQRQLNARGWLCEDLLRVSDLNQDLINDLIQNKRHLTLDVAERMEQVFGISAGTWMRHEMAYWDFVKG